MSVFYNENAPFPAQWLRTLIAAGHLPEGDVDERSISELAPADLAGRPTAHFFAGIGGWPYALRLAGWPDDLPVWTGSCPCQPFSVAGKRGGFADERHLWPVWFRLIRECRPHVIFGEQVGFRDGVAWFDLVAVQLEEVGYSVGAVVLPAASIGAPHLRQRLFFVADREGERRQAGRPGEAPRRKEGEPTGHRADGAVGDAGGARLERRQGQRGDVGEEREAAERAGGAPRPVGNAERRERDGLHERFEPWHLAPHAGGTGPRQVPDAASGPTAGFWSDAEWLYCRDGKSRATIARLYLLAHGFPGRMVAGDAEASVKEVNRAATTENGPAQAMRSLQAEPATQEIRPHPGVLDGIQPSPLLQQKVHGEGDDGSDQVSCAEEQPSSSGAHTRDQLPEVREVGKPPICPSQRFEPAQQHLLEFADFVRLLPSALAFAELLHDDRTAKAVRALLAARPATRTMLDAPHAVQEIWRSVAEEDKARLFVGFRAAGFVSIPVSPLTQRWVGRVGQLRGFGNAIVPPLAAEFVRAYMTTRGIT